MKIFATFPFFILIIGFLTFQSAYAYPPKLYVLGPSSVTIGSTNLFDIVCNTSISRQNIELYIQSDNGYTQMPGKSGINPYWILARGEGWQGGVGEHFISVKCIDDSGETSEYTFNYDEYHAQQTTSTQVAQTQQQEEQINPQNSFHFDNGLFFACLVVFTLITIVLIGILSRNGHFKKHVLQPKSEPTVFEILQQIRRSGDNIEIDFNVEKLIKDILDNPVTAKSVIESIAKNPNLMRELKRIEARNNLGRVCVRCGELLRDNFGMVTHCELCCAQFSKYEELDRHFRINHKGAGGI